MLTGRGWSFLILSIMLLMCGILLLPQTAYFLGILAVTLLGWFFYEWLLFVIRVRIAVPKLVVRRQICIENREVKMVWAGRTFIVRIDIDAPHKIALPYLVLEDLIPAESKKHDGRNEHAIDLRPGDELTFEYQLECSAPGVLRFEGQKLQLADLQGFFYFRTFLRAPVEIPVLPPLIDADGLQRTDKRLNILPPPGVHRLRGAGSGSELLDLRDYRPGDPPKMIAWKPSVRKDKLIVKEFETEVPIRCTLFIDTSHAVRLGPPGKNSLSELVTIGAAVAQAATAANRDLVGLTLFDETGTQVVRPARGSRHLIDLLHRLAHASSLPAVGRSTNMLPLARLSLSLANEVYPDLMRNGVNKLPWRMFWRPLLDSARGWRVLLLMAIPLLTFWSEYRGLLANLAFETAPSRKWMPPLFILYVILPFLIGLFFWGLYGIRGYLDTTAISRRKRLAAVIAQTLQLPFDAVGRMQVDDESMMTYLQQFLAKHHVPYPIALYDENGQYQFRSAEKVKILAAALANAVGRGRDNELYVLFVDLLELDKELEPLMNAVRMAKGRHHQVLLVCPWLQHMPAPEKFQKRDSSYIPQTEDELADYLREEEIERYLKAYEHVRHEFGRVGVTVLRVNQGDSVRLILDRMERLRHVGRVRR